MTSQENVAIATLHSKLKKTCTQLLTKFTIVQLSNASSNAGKRLFLTKISCNTWPSSV